MTYKIELTEAYKKKEKKFFKKHSNLINKYSRNMQILQQNPSHPSLQLHKLSGKLQDYYSISIDMSYLVVIEFIIEDEIIKPINIGTHDEAYR